MTACLRCVRLEQENRDLRALTQTLWGELTERWHQQHGYDKDPVPPLMMGSGLVFLPESEAA